MSACQYRKIIQYPVFKHKRVKRCETIWFNCLASKYNFRGI